MPHKTQETQRATRLTLSLPISGWRETFPWRALVGSYSLYFWSLMLGWPFQRCSCLQVTYATVSNNMKLSSSVLVNCLFSLSMVPYVGAWVFTHNTLGKLTQKLEKEILFPLGSFS